MKNLFFFKLLLMLSLHSNAQFICSTPDEPETVSPFSVCNLNPSYMTYFRSQSQIAEYSIKYVRVPCTRQRKMDQSCVFKIF
jgi:hypothetical protein